MLRIVPIYEMVSSPQWVIHSFPNQFLSLERLIGSLFLEGTFTVAAGDSLSVDGPGCGFFASVLAIGNSLQFCWDDFVRCPPSFFSCLESNSQSAGGWKKGKHWSPECRNVQSESTT